MDRTIPVASKTLAKKWTERDQQKHTQKVKSMSAAVDNKTPPRRIHLEQRAKKRQLESERFDQINRDNQTLLRRIDYHNQLRHPARLDNVLVQQGPKSLNIITREKEVQGIAAENMRLHNRLTHVKAVMSTARLEKDFQRSRQNFKHLCQNPVVMGLPRRPASADNAVAFHEQYSRATERQTRRRDDEIGADVERVEAVDTGAEPAKDQSANEGYEIEAVAETDAAAEAEADPRSDTFITAQIIEDSKHPAPEPSTEQSKSEDEAQGRTRHAKNKKRR